MVTSQIETLSAPRKQTHSETVLLHAAARLSVQESLVDPSEISHQFRTFLKIEDPRLKMAHRRGAPGIQPATARSAALDLAVTRADRPAVSLGQAACTH